MMASAAGAGRRGGQLLALGKIIRTADDQEQSCDVFHGAMSLDHLTMRWSKSAVKGRDQSSERR